MRLLFPLIMGPLTQIKSVFCPHLQWNINFDLDCNPVLEYSHVKCLCAGMPVCIHQCLCIFRELTLGACRAGYYSCHPGGVCVLPSDVNTCWPKPESVGVHILLCFTYTAFSAEQFTWLINMNRDSAAPWALWVRGNGKKKKKMTGHRLRTSSFFGPETVGDEFHHLSFAVLWPDIRTHVALVTWRAVIQSKWRGNLNGMLEQIAAPLIYSFFQAGRQADKTKAHS